MTLDRLLDPIVYLKIVGAVEAMFVLFLAVCALVLVRRRGWRWFRNLVGSVSLFAAVLLVFGAIANSIWMLSVYGRLYVSADTVVDFWPFIPFGQWVLDQTYGNFQGHLLGEATLLQLRALWLVLATAVWASTWAVCRRFGRGAA